MKQYKHLFFDLDRTLWDFDLNSAETLIEAVSHFKLEGLISNTGLFIQNFNIHNNFVWEMYRQKKMDKHTVRYERFRLALEPYNITDKAFIDKMQAFYLANAPLKKNLFDNCIEVLDYLFRKYNLYIVTNGFYETQLKKMQSSDIDRFFKKVFTSDKLGYSKPDSKIFEYAIKSVNARKCESLFIGDDFVNDIEGPKKFGIDQVWLKTNHVTCKLEPTYTIESLQELKTFL
ncbi:MAG: YjjG family noncanonical pyrimidine nucleotidase [Bacteroidales bacterium]|nr:YjjG family noncanonical pyrimidine nucleotidase [Bacteroidales bacterium]